MPIEWNCKCGSDPVLNCLRVVVTRDPRDLNSPIIQRVDVPVAIIRIDITLPRIVPEPARLSAARCGKRNHVASIERDSRVVC